MSVWTPGPQRPQCVPSTPGLPSLAVALCRGNCPVWGRLTVTSGSCGDVGTGMACRALHTHLGCTRPPRRPQGAPPPSLGFPFAMCLWPPVPCGGVWAGAAWARRPPLSPCWWAVARASRAQQASGFPTSLAVTSDPGVTEDAELGPRVFHRLVNGAEHRPGISRAHRPQLSGAPSLPSTSSPPSLPDTPPASAHHPSPPWAWPADGGSPPSGF